MQLVQSQELKPYELDEILSGTFVNKGWNATWITGNELVYTLDEDKNVYKYNVEDGSKEILFHGSVLVSL